MKRRDAAYVERNAEADVAWDQALAPARLPLDHPDRIPYPDAARAALAAYDEVIRKHGASADEDPS